MTDVAQAAGSALGAAVTGGIKKAETAVETVIGKIATGSLTLWHDIEAEIEGDVAKVQKALPASATTGLAQVETDVKQSASDTLSLLANGAIAVEPAAVKALEGLLDNAFAAGTNGVALPLVPFINGSIEQTGSFFVGVIQAWQLKKKASLVAAPAATPAA